jgi:hypothetical protein
LETNEFGLPETSQDAKETSPQGVRKRCKILERFKQQTHTQDIKIATVKLAHRAPLEDKHIF